MANSESLAKKLSENPNFMRDEFFMIDTPELLEEVNKATDFDLQYKTLRSWIHNYDFPKPLVRSEGRAKGVKGYYPRTFIELIIDILKEKERGIHLKKAVTDSLLKYSIDNYTSMMRFTKLLSEAYLAQGIKNDIKRSSDAINAKIKAGVRKNYEQIIADLKEILDYENAMAKRKEKLIKVNPLGKLVAMYLEEYLLTEQVVKYYADTQVKISTGETSEIAAEILNVINIKEHLCHKGEKLLKIILKLEPQEGDKNVFTV